MKMSAPKIKILTLDGGGIRGILPCAILAELEKRLNKPVSQVFDLMAGTSTGGIIACGLNLPDPGRPGQPKFSAATFGQLYEKDGAKIFKKRGGMFSGVTSASESSGTFGRARPSAANRSWKRVRRAFASASGMGCATSAGLPGGTMQSPGRRLAVMAATARRTGSSCCWAQAGNSRNGSSAMDRSIGRR